MEELKNWLKEKGWTQKDLAKEVNRTPTYIGFILNGQRQPGPALSLLLSQITGIPAGYFRPDLWPT
jgi:transcriptional regulator with XRE-family HTH domain